MKKIHFLSVMLAVIALPLMVSCSKDDEGGIGSSSDKNKVVIDENGKASNGSTFFAIDDKNFYLDNIKYTVEDGHLVVTGYDEVLFRGVAEIVSSITYKGNTYNVLGIGRKAFYGCDYLTSVNIPSSITSIGDRAFWYCNHLTSVHITDLSAWCRCNNDGFDYVLHLYLNGKEVTNLVIPGDVTSIGNGAFSHCTSLLSVTIPNSVTSIGDGAFCDCSGLTSVTIPNGVTSIGVGAFEGCTSLKSMTIPNSVTSIGGGAFEGCRSLTSVTIGNGVTSIGEGAFRDCSGLVSVTIPDGVTSIGLFAFNGCTSLKSVSIPSSVKSIGSEAFWNCNNLESVHIMDLSAWCKRDDTSAFYGTSAFYDIPHLYLNGKEVTDLVIPNDVTSISNDAFYGCSGLTSVTIGNSVTSIDYHAFYGCSGLTAIHSLNTTPPHLETDCFSSTTYSEATLYVPQGSMDAYKYYYQHVYKYDDKGWSQFQNIVEE